MITDLTLIEPGETLVIPKGKVAGLSKLARTVKNFISLIICK